MKENVRGEKLNLKNKLNSKKLIRFINFFILGGILFGGVRLSL